MVQIFKYPAEIGEFSLLLPIGAVYLTAQVQNEQPFIWFRVDIANDVEARHFKIVGTGHKFEPKGMHYRDTFQQGPLVWHLHETSGL